MIPTRIDRARARLATIAAAEGADSLIDPRFGTRAWLQADVAPVAVLLLHGFTNSPPQYAQFAPQLAARGHAVIVPRMPYHGYRDRMTDALRGLRAHDFAAAALEGAIVAALCGRRVVVLGISVGAVLAGWLAARVAIDTAIAIAPFCGIRAIPGGLNDGFGALLRGTPNRFSWWDPRTKEAQPPPHGYPRFATRALGEAILLSSDLFPRAPGTACARRVVVVFNDHEPAVNNAFAARRFRGFERHGVRLERVDLHGLPEIHDTIEPEIPQARTDLVYPRLIELIEST